MACYSRPVVVSEHPQLRARGVLDEHSTPVHAVARGLKTVEQGAATSVWCATSPQLNGIGSVYCEDVDVARVDEPATVLDDSYATRHTGVMPYAIDPEAAERLWSLSEQLVGQEGNPAA